MLKRLLRRTGQLGATVFAVGLMGAFGAGAVPASADTTTTACVSTTTSGPSATTTTSTTSSTSTPSTTDSHSAGSGHGTTTSTSSTSGDSTRSGSGGTASQGASGLAFTGFDGTALILFGLGAVASGALIVVSVRRRRRPGADSLGCFVLVSAAYALSTGGHHLSAAVTTVANCGPPANLPEAPMAILMPVVAGIVFGVFWLAARYRGLFNPAD